MFPTKIYSHLVLYEYIFIERFPSSPIKIVSMVSVDFGMERLWVRNLSLHTMHPHNTKMLFTKQFRFLSTSISLGKKKEVLQFGAQTYLAQLTHFGFTYELVAMIKVEASIVTLSLRLT